MPEHLGETTKLSKPQQAGFAPGQKYSKPQARLALKLPWHQTVCQERALG